MRRSRGANPARLTTGRSADFPRVVPTRPSASRPARSRAMAPRIVLLPGDGIGPEIIGPAVEVLDAVGAGSRIRRARVRRRLDRRSRDRPDRRDARGVPEGRCSAAGSDRRPQVGHHRPFQATPGAGPSGVAQGPGPVREPAAGQADSGAVRRQPAQARADRSHQPDRGARAHRRDLLRREDADGRSGVGRLRVHARGDRADRPGRVQSREVARHQRRQGQRARDQPAVA